MKQPVWLNREALLLLHSESLAEHGGSSGIRDEGLFDSALARPVNRYASDSGVDIEQLAARYGFGLAKNHAFIDGNKRIAFVAVATFLRLNGFRLRSTRIAEIEFMLSVAAGEASEDELAEWIRKNSANV